MNSSLRLFGTNRNISTFGRYASTVLLLGAAVIGSGCGDRDEVQIQADGGTAKHGDYLVRFNVVPTQALSGEAAEDYGITADDDTYQLNISVHERNSSAGSPTVKAALDAAVVTANAQILDIPMTLVSRDGFDSYFGTVSIPEASLLQFTVEVQPSDALEPFTVAFDRQVGLRSNRS